MTSFSRLLVLCPVVSLLFSSTSIAESIMDSAFSPEPSRLVTTPINRAITDRLMDAITEAESEQGPYGAELSQLYAALGEHWQSQNKHDKAVPLFKQALQVERINNGLYSSGQEQLLNELIDSAIALGEYEDADNYMHHWRWLVNEHSSETPDQFLSGIRSLASEHMSIYFSEDKLHSSTRNAHLLSANQWISSAVTTLESQAADEEMIPWLYDLSISAYYLSVASAASNRAITEDRAKSADPSGGQSKGAFLMQQYKAGEQALARLVAIYREETEGNVQSVFEAELMLGDWYLLYNRPMAARSQYQKAYDTLFEYVHYSPDEQVILQPVSLPKMARNKALEITSSDQPYALVRYDVSAQGKAHNVEVIEANVDNSRALARLKRSISQRTYRPKLVNGIVAEAIGVEERLAVQ